MENVLSSLCKDVDQYIVMLGESLEVAMVSSIDARSYGCVFVTFSYCIIYVSFV